eukprot:g10384.t1 g10384   contig4:1770487-1771005(-)
MHSLCGRGGSINSHAGNVVFRQWITERKESYNLADTKNDKSRVANDIMLKVRSLRPPGRFLHKIPDKSSGGSNDLDENGYWVEVDDIKAMAKISQALREGAPAFRDSSRKEQNEQTTKVIATQTKEQPTRSQAVYQTPQDTKCNEVIGNVSRAKFDGYYASTYWYGCQSTVS